MATLFPTRQFDNGNNIPLMITAGYGSYLKSEFSDPAPYFGIGGGSLAILVRQCRGLVTPLI